MFIPTPSMLFGILYSITTSLYAITTSDKCVEATLKINFGTGNYLAIDLLNQYTEIFAHFYKLGKGQGTHQTNQGITELVPVEMLSS